MYLRHTTRRKDGKVHTYWQLVRSVRVRLADRLTAEQERAGHPTLLLFLLRLLLFLLHTLAFRHGLTPPHRALE